MRPLTQMELGTYLSQAQDERSFWLTRYETEWGAVYRGGHRLHTDKLERVPFSSGRASSVPAIPVLLRSAQEYRALLDTSARSGWTEFRVALDEQLIPLGPPPHRMFPDHADDPVPGFASVATRMLVGALRVDAALLYVKGAHGPMEGLFRRGAAPASPVVLGGDFIRAFYYLQIDFPGRAVVLSTTRSFVPDERRLITSLPMSDYYGIIAVEGFLDDVPTPFLLDSLGAYSVATADQDRWDTVGQVMLGDLVLRNLPHSDSHELGLGLLEVPRIGRDVLERFVVTFDAENRLVHFERP